jgi:hypothetical protein
MTMNPPGAMYRRIPPHHHHRDHDRGCDMGMDFVPIAGE